MKYLVDTNIFLEILLDQPGRKRCKKTQFRRELPGEFLFATKLETNSLN